MLAWGERAFIDSKNSLKPRSPCAFHLTRDRILYPSSFHLSGDCRASLASSKVCCTSGLLRLRFVAPCLECLVSRRVPVRVDYVGQFP
jgi:hypothetical protein